VMWDLRKLKERRRGEEESKLLDYLNASSTSLSLVIMHLGNEKKTFFSVFFHSPLLLAQLYLLFSTLASSVRNSIPETYENCSMSEMASSY
jgi:hypothetical protein